MSFSYQLAPRLDAHLLSVECVRGIHVGTSEVRWSAFFQRTSALQENRTAAEGTNGIDTISVFACLELFA